MAETTSDADDDRLVAVWREAGVTSLEQAARWTVERFGGGAEPEPAPPDLDWLLEDVPSEAARTVVHEPLRSPIVVDGQEVDDLTRFNGQPLHYVVDLSVFEAGGRVRAFTSRRELVDAVTELEAARPSGDARVLRRDDQGLIGVLPYCQFTDYCDVFQHAGYGGDRHGFGPPGHMWRELSEVPRGLFGDWEDVISSVANSRSLRGLFKNPVPGPLGPWLESLWLSPGVEAWNLDRVPGGWNDQISAVYNKFDAC